MFRRISQVSAQLVTVQGLERRITALASLLILVSWFAETDAMRINLFKNASQNARNFRVLRFLIYGTAANLSVVSVKYIILLSRALYNALIIWD